MADFLNLAVATFRMNVDAASIAATKATVESTYDGVGFIYTGVDYEYTVSMTGPIRTFQRALNYLFPKGRADIINQPSQINPNGKTTFP